MGSCSSKPMPQSKKEVISSPKQPASMCEFRLQNESMQFTAPPPQQSYTNNQLNKTGFVVKQQLHIHQHKMDIFRNYSILEKGFSNKSQDSKVVVIQHNLTGKIFQAKMIPWDGITIPEYITWLTKQQLSHPNLQQTYETYQDGSHIFLVQEYCSGQTLPEYCKELGKLSELAASLIMMQIIQAVNFLHNQSMIHENLTLDSFQLLDDSKTIVIKLIDIYSLFKPPTVATKRTAPYWSPDQWNFNKRNYAGDIWACGMICHILITGDLPFSKEFTAEQIKKQTIRGAITFDSIDFDKISRQGKYILQKMLMCHSHQRYTAVQCLQDPWLINSSRQFKTQNAMSGLKDAKKVNQLQACVLLFMIHHYFSSQQQQLLLAFESIDTNKDMKLSFNEVLISFQKVFGAAESQEQVMDIFNRIDTDNSGTIDFQEYILATTDKKALITKEKLEETFKIIDKDRNGQISVKELATQFQIEHRLVKLFIEEVDIDKNGQLSLLEFKELMLRLL